MPPPAPLNPRHWHYQRAGGVLALLLAVALGVSGCAAERKPTDAPERVAPPDVYLDSLRGVACYSYRADGYVSGRSLSCVKVRP